ncbi:MAG: Ig-like domain-containing protein, partial [Acidimicrobiia bacterium]
TFTPAADANGSSTVDITAVDNGGTAHGGIDTSTIHTITITVTAVNDVPSFTGGGDPAAVDEDSGTSSTPGWATGMSVGPSDESAQTFSFVVTSDDNPGLFSTAPAVSVSGTLSFTPGANRFGVAYVGIAIMDSGGTANDGIDQSASQFITITVNNVDDPPNAVNDVGIVIPESAGPTAINVLANDTYLPDPPETLTIVAVTQGSHGVVAITGGGTGLTYDPTQLYVGPDQFTYTIQDSGGPLQDTATVALTDVKDTTPPTISPPVESIRTGVALQSAYLYGHLTWGGSDAGVGLSSFQLQRSVNGGAYASVALSTAKATALNPSLTIGTSYRYRVRAADLNGNWSGWSYGPTFKPYRYQESSTTVHYGGTWTSWYSASNSGGYARYTTVANRYVTFAVSGRDFAFVAPKGSTRGSARIYVDGVLAATVSLKSTTTLYRQVLWSKHFTASATHTIKVVVVGNGRVDVDCFVALR